MQRVLLGIFLLFFISTSSVLLIYMLNKSHKEQEINRAFPQFSLPHLHTGEYLTEKIMKGKKKQLVNIFASWCSGCLIEHPLLLNLTRDVKIIGISWRDEKERTLGWLNKYGNPYDIVIEDKDSKLAIKLGITGAPETFLLNEEGVIIRHWAGPLNQGMIDEIYEAL